MDAAIGWATVAAVALLAGASLRTNSQHASRLYPDKDGTATQESEAEAFRRPFSRIALNMAAAIGGSVSVMDTCYSPHAAQWRQWQPPPMADVPQLTVWFFISIQSLVLGNAVMVRQRFNQAIWLAMAAALVLFPLMREVSLSGNETKIPLVQPWCAVIIIYTCSLLPRRPVLYHNGHRVDEHTSTSLASLLYFSWYPLYKPFLARLEKPELKDLPVLPLSQRLRTIRDRFNANQKQRSLFRRLLWTWRYTFALQWLVTLAHSLSQFLGQYMLLHLLRCLESGSTSQRPAVAYAMCMGLSLLAENISAGWVTWITQAKLNVPIAAFTKGLLFEKMTVRKMLREAEPTARDEPRPSSLGALVSKDCSSISQICNVSQQFPKIALRLLLDVTYLTHLIGIKHILVGSLFPIILFPISKLLAHQHRYAKLELSKRHNAVSEEVSELLRNLRQVRLSFMEDLWQKRVVECRAREQAQIWRCEIIMALLTLVTNLGPILLVSVALCSYALEVGHLSPSLAFASVGLFRTLHTTLQELPSVFTNFQESLAASQRVQAYLQESEKAPITAANATRFVNATISWPKSEGHGSDTHVAFRLQNVNLQFPTGKLSVISGKTGSGKGLLLSALLGEAKIEAGSVQLAGLAPNEKSLSSDQRSIAFASQPPWIENRTIQENILFDCEYHEARYLNVLRACALERDLELLSEGDTTKAGVNGGTLSGGQKWRVSLARALYSSATTIILDDVLGAVDPHVARWICQKALSGDLVRGRTVIIATHHLALCEHLASYIVTVEDGTASGRQNSTNKMLDPRLNIEIVPRSANNSPKPELEATTPKMHVESVTTSNRTSVQAFKKYLLGSGMWVVLVVAVATLVCRVFAVANSWWLTRWTSVHRENALSLRLNLYIYLALSVSSAVAVAVHTVAVQALSIRASKALFQKTVATVLHSPLRWVDSTSLGRLMQTLVPDMNLIDHRVATGLSDLLRIAMQLLVIAFTSGIATPQTTVLMGFVLGLYSKITLRHLGIARKLNRLAPLASQPILEHVDSTELGIKTIRAYGKSQSCVERMYDLLDVDVCLNWHIILGQRWIHGRYGFLGTFFVFATTMALIEAGTDAAAAGFIINAALQLKATMSGMMGKVNLLTGGSRAIERVLDISEGPIESPDGDDVAEAWPDSGTILVEDITVRYDAALPPVLRNVSFSLASGERLGVVGRTGSGKTSLFSALLRFIDADQGAIRIDGIDIASVKRHKLRQSVTVIPQDPFLFADTLRANLNIHGDKTDGELLGALRKVRVQQKDGDSLDGLRDLDMAIQPGGVNMSYGQRQMICLARAILSPRRIVMLDEATSAMDKATDALIQGVIREEFADSTILVVAHRLDTVADFDKVLVLSEGEAVEFGSPSDLMERRGVFWDMVNQSGDASTLRSAVKSG